MLKFYLVLIVLCIQISVNASDLRTLLTIENKDISVDEFKRVYEKNNFDNAADYSEKSLKEYLDLFVQFRLKLLDAKEMGLADNLSVRDEYNAYAQQLYNNHFDKKITHLLILDAYERMQYDVGISHVFIKPSDNSDEDVKRINNLYQKISNGEKFEDIAEKFSEDPYSSVQKGFLGYFTGMQISLPELEDAAYSTPVGQITKPFKTNAGYHILRVEEKRNAVGKIKISIIKKSKQQGNEEQNIKARNDIFEIYQKLLSGDSFATLAKEHSDDVYSKEKGGEIDWFGVSTYAYEFEKEAFALKNNGDITKPFETNFAWYIIKKEDCLPPAPLEDIYNAIKAQVYKSSRFEQEKNKHIQSILDKYGYKEINPDFENFRKGIIAKLNNDEKIVYTEQSNSKDVIQVVGVSYNENDLGSYINRYITRSNKKFPSERFDQLLNDFIHEKATAFHKEKLGEEDEEYGSVLNEYFDGIILFEIMNKRVWNKAVEDTLGLRTFYNNNKKNYLWEEMAVVEQYEMNPKAYKYFLKQLSKRKSKGESEWAEILSKKGISYKDAIKKELSKEELSTYGLEWKLNSLSTYSNEGNMTLYLLSNIIPKRQKTFNESRGFVVADYQKYLEKEWIKELKVKYSVNINNDVLKSLIIN